MKRIISIFMLVCILVSFCTVSAFAENLIANRTDFAQRVSEAADGDTITLTETGEFEMPASVNDKHLTIIGLDEGNTSITFPNGYSGNATFDFQGVTVVNQPGGSNAPNGGNTNPGVQSRSGGITDIASLQAAIDAAPGSTITLSAPLTSTGTASLDLKGCTVKYESTKDGEAMITNKGILTITDSLGGGKLSYQYTENAVDPYEGGGNYTIANCGTLTMTGVTAENTTNKPGHMYDVIDNNANNSNATLTLNNCTLSCPNYIVIRQIATKNHTNTVTINGGDYKGLVWVQNNAENVNVKANASLTINSGNFEPWDGDNRAVLLSNSQDAFELNVNGGAFGGTITAGGETPKGELINDDVTFDTEEDAEGSKNLFNGNYVPTLTPVKPASGAGTVGGNSSSNPYSIPSTGDMSNMPLWSLLLIGFAAVALMTRKKKA